MPPVSKAFFVYAALCGTFGMGWGIYMGVAHDHSTFPAHAHLNLLGWVSAALMGGFYSLAKDRASGILPWVNFSLFAFGGPVMIMGLTGKLTGVTASWPEMGIAIGALSAFAGMLTFTIVVILTAFRPAAARSSAAMLQPAA